MNKVYLKRFMKDIHNDKKAEQENKYIKYDDRYLISNNCSVVLLNSDYGVLTENNGKIKDTIKNIYEDFRDRFCLNAVDVTDEINNFNTSEELIKFVQLVQKCSPVDGDAVPMPWDMPGYDDQVIMA